MVSNHCKIGEGRWFSYYDNAYTRQAGDLDIDHVASVPATS
ncbi:hypothetical protein ACWD04_33655 [Streptomyces sp. NPDC002911]